MWGDDEGGVPDEETTFLSSSHRLHDGSSAIHNANVEAWRRIRKSGAAVPYL